MNRRKAISIIALTGLGTAGAFKWWSFSHAPDLTYLHQNRALLDALGETIIPATDSPGAKAAGVTDFIIAMICDCTPRKEQNSFISGLQALQTHCMHAYGRSFEFCNSAEQKAALTEFEKRGQPWSGIPGKIYLRLTGRSFFAILKDYTVEGFCTSQPGATRGLSYVYIPGAYRPCTSLLPDQKAWATN